MRSVVPLTRLSAAAMSSAMVKGISWGRGGEGRGKLVRDVVAIVDPRRAVVLAG